MTKRALSKFRRSSDFHIPFLRHLPGTTFPGPFLLLPCWAHLVVGRISRTQCQSLLLPLTSATPSSLGRWSPVNSFNSLPSVPRIISFFPPFFHQRRSVEVSIPRFFCRTLSVPAGLCKYISFLVFFPGFFTPSISTPHMLMRELIVFLYLPPIFVAFCRPPPPPLLMQPWHR